LEHIRVGAWRAVALSNDALRLVVVPELGGKIISMVSRRSGREWLWSNPYLPLRRPPPGVSDFGHYDTGGWDEVFPTVNPCQVPDSAWGDRMLTDHGELWYRSWQTIAAELVPQRSATLTLAVDHPELPFRFKRALTLAADVGPLTASYELTNRSGRPLPYIWAAHPLLAIEPGDTIQLPAGTPMSSTDSVGLEFAGGTASFAWPTARLASGHTLDWSYVPGKAAGFAAKLFAQNVSMGFVEIIDKAQQDCIRLLFSPTRIPYIGLWLNYGGWSRASTEPYFNIGVEPTTSPYDDLKAAVQQNAASPLQKGESRRWQLVVAMGQPQR
jgi:galactose mutarotase-like enzyme